MPAPVVPLGCWSERVLGETQDQLSGSRQATEDLGVCCSRSKLNAPECFPSQESLPTMAWFKRQ